MTYKQFETLVKEAHPNIIITSHGGLAGGRSKSSVAVCFTPGGRLYEYGGTYNDVLDKLNVPAKYKVALSGEIMRFWINKEAVDFAASVNTWREEKVNVITV